MECGDIFVRLKSKYACLETRIDENGDTVQLTSDVWTVAVYSLHPVNTLYQEYGRPDVSF